MYFSTTTCPPTLLLVLQSRNLTFLTPYRTRIWHLTQIDNHMEGIIGFYLNWKLRHPTLSKITFDDLKEDFFLLKMEVFPSLEEETRLPPFQGFSQIWIWIGPLSNHWHYSNAGSLLLTAPRSIDLGLKLDSDQLFLSLEIIDHATFALIT